MPQDNAARADNGEEGPYAASVSKKRPTLHYDNGHGTKVVRWDEGVSNIQIERSYMPKGGTDPSKRVTEKITVTPEEGLGIAFGIQDAVKQHMEKLQAQQQDKICYPSAQWSTTTASAT